MPFTFVSFCARFDLILPWCIGVDGDAVKQTTPKPNASRTKILLWTERLTSTLHTSRYNGENEMCQRKHLNSFASESAVSIVRMISAPFFCTLNEMFSLFICGNSLRIACRQRPVLSLFGGIKQRLNCDWLHRNATENVLVGTVPRWEVAQLMHLSDLRRRPDESKKKIGFDFDENRSP